MQIKKQESSPKANNYDQSEQNKIKPKRKLTLTIPSMPELQKDLVPIQGTRRFLLQEQTRQTGNSSSSTSISQRAFFRRSQPSDFDEEGLFYFIRGRNNGKAMEDKHIVVPEFKSAQNCSFYGVYDGHSTDLVSEMLKNKLHQYVIESYLEQGSISQAYVEGFEKIEKEAIAKLKASEKLGGSTALCVTVKDNTVYTANLGDCRAIVTNKKGYKALNNIHDFSNKNEELAVSQRGGVILERGNTKRLNGELAISRSVGDYNYKDYISSSPEVSEYQLTPSDSFLLLATDGFWNVITPEKATEAIELIQSEFKEFNSLEKISEYLIEMACNTRQNIKRDNMILIIIDLKKFTTKINDNSI